MRKRSVVLIAGIVIAAASPARAQSPAPFLDMQPTRFESWSLDSSLRRETIGVAVRPAGRARSQGRHALVGGVIGAVAGAALCTAVSNLAGDAGDGFSTCTRDGYLLFGSVGFAVGFALGWAL